MTINLKLKFIVLSFTVIITLMLLATFYATSHQKQDVLLINLAGRQRMLTQKMTKEMLLYRSTIEETGVADKTQAEQVRATMEIFSTTLKALLHSGKAPLSLDSNSTDYHECKAAKEPALSQLIKVDRIWQEFAPKLAHGFTSKYTTEEKKYISKTNIELLKEMSKAVGMMQKQSEREITQLLIQQTVLVIIGMAFAVFAFFIVQYVIGSLRKLVTVMDRLEAGDMTTRINIATKDEIGNLARSTDMMAEQFELNLIKMQAGASTTDASINILNRLTDDMATSAKTMADDAATVAVSAEEMNGNMAAIAAASEETSINVSQVAEGAKMMSTTISEIASNSDEAILITENAVTKAAEAEESVRTLGSAAQEISKVTEAINEIADQTNLLALNATIEAARAGEAGKGFAVVANEIKELAKQTTDATLEIKERINGVQNSSEQTITVINSIASTIKQTNEIVTTMATAVQEQAQASVEISDNVGQASMGIQEVNENIAQASTVNSGVANDVVGIKTNAQGVAAHTSDIKELSKELRVNSEALSNQVKQFTFRKTPFQIGEVKAAHFNWQMKLSSFVAGYQEMTEKDIPDHHQCEFGKWVDNAPESLKRCSGFDKMNKHHEEVHKKVLEAVKVMNKSSNSGASKQLQEFDTARKMLFEDLDKLYTC